MNLLVNPDFYAGYFHEVYFFTTTEFGDPKVQVLREARHVLAKPPRVEIHKKTAAESNDDALNRMFHYDRKPKKKTFTGKLEEKHFPGVLTEKKLQKIRDQQHSDILKYGQKGAKRVLVVIDDHANLPVVRSETLIQNSFDQVSVKFL